MSCDKAARVTVVEFDVGGLLIVLVCGRLYALTPAFSHVPDDNLVAVLFIAEADQEVTVAAKTKPLNPSFMEPHSVEHVHSLEVPDNDGSIEA